MIERSSFLRDAFVDHIPHLRSYARSLCRDRDRADDLVQDALLAAWEKRSTLRDQERLRPWLLQILRNVYLMAIRRGREQTNIDQEQLENVPDQSQVGGNTNCGDIEWALAKLTPMEREGIILVGVQELSYEEAARVSGCPVGTMKSRVNRARENLRRLLDASVVGTSVQSVRKNSANCSTGKHTSEAQLTRAERD